MKKKSIWIPTSQSNHILAFPDRKARRISKHFRGLNLWSQYRLLYKLTNNSLFFGTVVLDNVQCLTHLWLVKTHQGVLYSIHLAVPHPHPLVSKPFPEITCPTPKLLHNYFRLNFLFSALYSEWGTPGDQDSWGEISNAPMSLRWKKG